jgi:hypothetical protein
LPCQALAQLGQVLAVGLEHVASVLHEREAGHRELARLADVEQLTQRAEPVAGRVHGLRRLVRQFGQGLVLGQVREVRDHEINVSRYRLEQVALVDVDAVADTVALGVLTREGHRLRVDVGRIDLHVRCPDRDRDADHAGAGPHVGNAQRPLVDMRERRIDKRLGRRPRSEDAPRRGEELESVKGGFHENGAVADWAEHFGREEERYRDGASRLPDAEDVDARQRQLTRLGNAAAGAGLALVMQGRTAEAREWFDRACERYRESWEDAPPGSWGRPIGILKARILAGDWEGAERDAKWTVEQGAGHAETPIGRYAAALAFTVLGEWDDARIVTEALRLDESFPSDVADAIAFIASPDPVAYVEAVESVLRSFETRDAYLEDLPAADTVLVLQALAERRGFAPAELESELLP